MPELPQLSVEHCRARQQRLRETLTTLKADLAILVSAENVQWLTGYRPHPLMQAAAVLEVDGDCLLIAPGREPEHHAADAVRTFESQWLCTLRQDQLQAAMRQVPRSAQRYACEHSMLGAGVQADFRRDPVDVDHAIWTLRRRKDADEMEMIRHAIACTDAMYRRAREIIEPGITELQVYSQLHEAAVLAVGEPLTDLGNDFQCNSPGGPPRDRKAMAGELMILDLGPAYRGYYADNCRTFAVDGRPTDEQLRAREVIISIFDLVREFVHPGAGCRELFERARDRLDRYQSGAFFHHLGHGIGLYPHEAPHLNPNWDDRFAEGDVFTVEPGLYTEKLHAGIRIEENFRVTADGVEQLSWTPTELA